MVQLNSDGKKSLGSGIAFLVVATVAVALRFYSKTFTKAKLAADDWWIGLSLIGFFAFIGVEFWGIFSGGGGENIQTLLFNFATLQTYLKSLYTLGPLFGLTVTTSRLSILSLYRRIFIPKRFQQITLVVGGFCVIWWIVFTVCTLNPCRPVKKFWLPQTPGHCYNFDQFILGISIVDILLDASILLLPIRPVLNLQMSKSRKMLLCAIFSVGGFVIITGIVRLSFLYVPHSQNINFTQGELWSNIHIGTAILCACLPTYRPTLSHIAGLATSFRTRISSLFSSRKPLKASQSEGEYTMGAYPKGLNRYNPIEDPVESRDRLREANIAHMSRGQSFDIVGDRDGNHITVENTVEVV